MGTCTVAQYEPTSANWVIVHLMTCLKCQRWEKQETSVVTCNVDTFFYLTLTKQHVKPHMLITTSHLKPGKILFHDVRLQGFFFCCCYWLHHRSILPLAFFLCVCVYVCVRRWKQDLRTWFSIMHPCEMWNLGNNVCKSHLYHLSHCVSGVEFIYARRNTLELKCKKSLLDELQTFSIRIWLDIYVERLRHKVKCQLFQTQLLSINNTWLLVWIAV